MPLKLYNSLRRSKEIFEPIEAQKVRMYVCGATVYDLSHLGHARANVVFDVLYRYLRSSGFEVSYVRNFTDIDDKIIQRSERDQIPWKTLTERQIQEFRKDMEALGNLPPSLEPKATEHIPQMIRIIQQLIGKGLAYEAGGDVFFRVRALDGYGKLSNKNLEELEAGARVEVLESKTDPLDFALWKKSKPGEPEWDSPWSKGRPGWHIECSAMSMEYLGESFDIHGGGRDLIFPHHENEIAQSEGATGKPFVKYWLHNGFVNINSHKMSKSTGNFFTIQEILKREDWEVVRAFLLSVHYRSPIDFTDQHLQDMQQALERYYSTVQRIQKFVRENSPGASPLPADDSRSEQESELLASFQEAMEDDLNTAMAFGHIFESVRKVNKLLDQAQQAEPAYLLSVCQRLLAAYQSIHKVLGCFGVGAEEFFERNKKRTLSTQALDEKFILQKIAQRKQAREAKDFKRADEIRQELLAASIVLKDRPDGTTEWSVK